MENNLATYDFGSGYDEMFVRPGVPREHCRSLLAALESLTASDINDARRRADLAFLNAGITFTVYSESSGIERIFPFDVIPRLIAPAEWDHIERGLVLAPGWGLPRTFGHGHADRRFQVLPSP